jgi:uncharacterized membrane protein YoaK (UPF0700 family)
VVAVPYSHPQPIDKTAALRRIRHLLPGAAALAANAGFLNTIALGFFQTPVSHMTGAVSHLGINAANGEWQRTAASLGIIVGFVAGAAVAGMTVGPWKLIPGRTYGVALMMEGGLLATAALMMFYSPLLSLPMVSMACGLQNAMTSSYCGLAIRTTHVTGIVTDIGVMVGHWLRYRQIDRWKLRFLVTVFGFFGLGGFMGAMADSRFGTISLAVPAFLCTVAGAIFWFIHHRGLVDLMQDAAPQPPHTGSLGGK